MNDIFDLLNSKSKYGPSMSDALRSDNFNTWKPFLDLTEEYLLGLKTIEGKSLVKEDRRKPGFLGIIVNIHSVQNIFGEHVVNGSLDYLATYKLSQDYLEHFFGLVRARFGSNVNPTPYQFKKIYRQILLGVTGSIVSNASVLLQDNTEFVGLIPTTQGKMDYLNDYYDLQDIDLEVMQNQTQSEYAKNVVDYISGYVVKKIVWPYFATFLNKYNIVVH